MRSIRVFAINMGDPYYQEYIIIKYYIMYSCYYEPTIVVHDIWFMAAKSDPTLIQFLQLKTQNFFSCIFTLLILL